MLTVVLIVFSIFAYILFYKFKNKSTDIFEQKGFPSVKTRSLLGDRPLFRNKLSVPDFILKLYNAFPKDRAFGMFNINDPIIVIKDPEMLRQLFVKDFDYFTDHKPVFDPDIDSLLGNSLVLLQGQKWRDMRATLSPAFTGSKMRQMFELISICGDNFAQHFLQEATKTDKLEYEMKEVFGRFANDVIATSAFGVQVDSFKDKDNEFYVTGRKMTNFESPILMLKFAGYAMFPKIMKYFNMRLLHGASSNYFVELIKSSIKYREENRIHRPDMLSLLMNVKQGKMEKNLVAEQIAAKDGFATVEESYVGKAVVKREWSDDEIFAQCFLFFLAGFDTVSTSLAFAAYEIALNPNVELKLYDEVQRANKELQGKLLTYEVLQNMKYMDMVVCETLRKWPPSPFTERVCVKDYVPKNDDDKCFKFEKGDNYWIPVYGLHRDPLYYPNPDKFDPERFSDENKHNINMNAYLPFGIGPRNCIGSRFALMEIKTVLYYLVLNFSIKTTEKTQIPLQFAKKLVGVLLEKGVWLEFQPRNK